MTNWLQFSRSISGWVMAVSAIIIASALLGRWVSVADPANLFAPYALILGAFALILRVLLRSGRRLALLVMIPLLLSYGFDLTRILLHDQMVARLGSSGRLIRIVSVNLSKDNLTPLALALWVRQQSPDLIVLLEASGQSEIVPNWLARDYPFQQSCARNGHCSTIILSRLAPTQMIPFAHGDSENRKALSAAAMVFPDFSLVGVHLSRASSVARQRAELAELAQGVGPLARRRLVVVGDWNASPLMYDMRKFSVETGLTNVGGIRPTWPQIALLPFDQIWVGQDIGVVASGSGPALGSDHHPIWLQFRAGTTNGA
jgi:endonuclease/exonuclease/phosphatase (EEP) superfamily protein YafD